MKTVTDLRIRAFEPDDYERLAAIHHANFPEVKLSPNEMRREDENFDTSKYVLKQYSAVRSGRMIGWSQYWHSPLLFHPLKFMIDIVVDPADQQSGVGSALYEHVMGELRNRQAILARCRVKEDMAASISFLKNRGFVEIDRSWESHLAVGEFSSENYREYVRRVLSSGVTITTLSEEARRDPSGYQKLYQLWIREAGQDVPWPDTYTPESFEDFMKHLINSPNMLHDGCFIAKVGDRYVGLSVSAKRETEPENLYQWFTGTIREYRGRGIAMALKLSIIEFAKLNGYEVIKTWNDSTNVGMLAINQKLGYRPHAGWITYEKRLTPASASN